MSLRGRPGQVSRTPNMVFGHWKPFGFKGQRGEDDVFV